MRTLGAALVLLLVAGCGQGGSVPPRTAIWGDCTVPRADAGGRVVARGALDGGRETYTLRLFGPGGGPCADGLVMRVGSSVWGIDVSGRHLDASTLRVVALHGSGDSIVVADSRPPASGGLQTHLFVPSSGRLVELTKNGAPLLPVVTTDGGEPPATATCEPVGRLAVWTATAHRPPGIVLSWDVRKTTYQLSSGKAVAESSVLVEDGAADPSMRRKMPQLFEPGGWFRDC